MKTAIVYNQSTQQEPIINFTSDDKILSRSKLSDEGDHGYIPDDDDDDDDNDGDSNNQLDIRQFKAPSKATSAANKKIVSKEVIDFILRTLIDIGSYEEKAATHGGNTVILIDGISRLIDITCGEDNIENR